MLSGGSTCFIAVIIMLYHVFGLPSKSRSEKKKEEQNLSEQGMAGFKPGSNYFMSRNRELIKVDVPLSLTRVVGNFDFGATINYPDHV